MKKVLVAYATMAGSTVETAQAVAEEIARANVPVEVRPLGEIGTLDDYQGVVLGAPMIMGWHREALGFLKKHRQALRQIPFAIFVLAMTVTRNGETRVGGMPVYLDEHLPKPPEQAGHLSFKERYALLEHYVQPILGAARPAKPASLAMFGGRLEYGRLPWWAVLFVTLVIQAPAGDRRNWTAIRSWAATLPRALDLETVAG